MASGVGLLLLLACVNVLNLTLGHVASRRTELTIRSVLGSGSWRLARLQLVQSLLLAVGGGIAGLALIAELLPVLLRLYVNNGQPPVDVRIDWRVAAFAAAVTIGTALISGVIPALRAQHESLRGGLAQAGSTRVGGSRWERRLRDGLVITQVALAVTLLCAAGAFVASLQRLLTTSPGFSPENVLSMQLTLAPTKYPDVAARSRFIHDILDRVATLPSVVAVGTTQTTFLPNQSMQTLLWIDGQPTDAEHTQTVHIRHITPGYFRALRVAIIDGRPIDDRDQIGTAPVCMVSARFAKRFWPHESAVDHRLRRISANAPWMTVIGVAADVMDAGLGVQQGPTVYIDYLQLNTATARVSLVVRAAGDAFAVAGDVRRAVWAVDRGQPVDRVERLTEVLIDSTDDQRFRTVLLSSFAVVGLALALVGVYGVTVAAVKSRTWEAGVRMALGATPVRVVLDMVGESGRRLTVGIVAGVIAFVVFGRFATNLLYQTSIAEPVVFAGAILPLAVLSMLVS